MFIFSYLCIDIDECVSGIDECDPVSTQCVNNDGSYTCVCKSGYAPYMNGSMTPWNCLGLGHLRSSQCVSML